MFLVITLHVHFWSLLCFLRNNGNPRPAARRKARDGEEPPGPPRGPRQPRGPRTAPAAGLSAQSWGDSSTCTSVPSHAPGPVPAPARVPVHSNPPHGKQARNPFRGAREQGDRCEQQQQGNLRAAWWDQEASWAPALGLSRSFRAGPASLQATQTDSHRETGTLTPGRSCPGTSLMGAGSVPRVPPSAPHRHPR